MAEVDLTEVSDATVELTDRIWKDDAADGGVESATVAALGAVITAGETAAREGGDAALAVDIATEEAARIAADDALTTSLGTKLNSSTFTAHKTDAAGHSLATTSADGFMAAADKAKLDSFVTPEQYGADPTGVASSSTAIQNMLVYASANGVAVKGTAGARYLIDSAVTVNRAGHGPCVVDWAGATLVFDDAGIKYTGGGSFLTTSLSADVDQGDTNFGLASVTGLAVGDLIEIDSPALTGGVINTLHYYVVSDLDGSTVHVDGFVVADITTAQIAASGQTGSIVVKAYKLAPGLQFLNADCEFTDTDGDLTAMEFVEQTDLVVSGITGVGNIRNAIYPKWCGYTLVKDCVMRDYGYVTEDQGYASIPGSPGGLSYGYGIIHARNYSSRVVNCEGGRGWHLCDVSRGQMNITITGTKSHKDGYAFSTHQGSWHVTIDGCEVLGGAGALLDGCSYLTVKNSLFRPVGHGVTIGGQNVTIDIVNNVFDMRRPVATGSTPPTGNAVGSSSEATTPKAGALSVLMPPQTTIKGNTFHGKSIVIAPSHATRADATVMVDSNTFTGAAQIKLGKALGGMVAKNNTAQATFVQYLIQAHCVPGSILQIQNNSFHKITGLQTDFVWLIDDGDGTEVIDVMGNYSPAACAAILRIFGTNVEIRSVNHNQVRGFLARSTGGTGCVVRKGDMNVTQHAAYVQSMTITSSEYNTRIT